MNQLAQDLRAAKALIDTPEKWTRGSYARTELGKPCLFTDARARCFCALGAIYRTCPAKLREFEAIETLKCAMGVDWIPAFNDYRTHVEVMAAFDTAIAAAEVSP